MSTLSALQVYHSHTQPISDTDVNMIIKQMLIHHGCMKVITDIYAEVVKFAFSCQIFKLCSSSILVHLGRKKYKF